MEHCTVLKIMKTANMKNDAKRERFFFICFLFLMDECRQGSEGRKNENCPVYRLQLIFLLFFFLIHSTNTH